MYLDTHMNIWAILATIDPVHYVIPQIFNQQNLEVSQ